VTAADEIDTLSLHDALPNKAHAQPEKRRGGGREGGREEGRKGGRGVREGREGERG